MTEPRSSTPAASPPPLKDPDGGRAPTYPRLPALSASDWVPDADDDSLRATAWRLVNWHPGDEDLSTRATAWRAFHGYRAGVRGERIAENTRDALGHPTRPLDNGKVDPATGLWALLEPIKRMADIYMAREDAAAEAAEARRGFVKERTTKSLDTVIYVVLGLVLGSVLKPLADAVIQKLSH